MVRVSKLGKPFGDKLYNTLKQVFNKDCEVIVIEHGNRLRIKIRNRRGDTVSLEKAIATAAPIVKKVPYNSFDGGDWCSFYYNYGY